MEKFLKRRMQHQMLFGWMAAVRHFMPSASLDISAKGFHKRFGLKMDECEIQSSLKEFNRMMIEEFDSIKTHDNKEQED